MTNTVIKITKPYTKIGDISTFKCLYALTKEVENYTGPCIRVLSNSIGAPEKDIYFLNNGKLDTATLLEYTGSGTTKIIKWYDQWEFDDLEQTTSSKQPVIVTTGVLETENGEPCVTFDNTNDFMSANIPYTSAEKVVSILALFTKSVDDEADMIVSTDTGDGLRMVHQSINKYRIDTVRTATTTLSSTDETAIGETKLIGGIADRVNIKIYENGVLNNTKADTNTDYLSASEIIIGSNAGTSSFSGGKYQFVGVSLNDESDNMAEFSTQLLSRYDSTIVNPDDFIYFSDTPELLSNGYYANGRLVGDISFTESIKVFPWKSITQGGFGTIDLVNIDGFYNSIVDTNYTKIDIYEYDGTTLTEFGNGDIKNIGFIEKGRIRFTLKSVIDKLNVELPTGRFTADDHADLENEKKQMVCGRANLVEGRLIDVSVNEYYIAEGLYNTVTAYDNAVSVAFTATDNGAKLTSNPVGRVLWTVDGIENAAGTDYEEHISEHVPRLLKNIDIEYDETGLASIYPAITSTWCGTDETVLQAINELLDGFISYMYADSSGELQFGTLALPTSPTDTLEERETIGEIKAFRDTAQGLSERLQNSRNYNPYSPEGIAFGATESDKINLIKEYKRTSVLSGLHPYYKDKNNVDMKSQSLGGITNGETILQDIIDLWSEIRYFYTTAAVKTFDLNQVITITHSQKALENGKDVLVHSKTKKVRTKKINYGLWG